MSTLSFLEHEGSPNLKLEVLRSAARIAASGFKTCIAGGPENMREHKLYEVNPPFPGAMSLREAHAVGLVVAYEISVVTGQPIPACSNVTLALLKGMREEAWRSERAESIFAIDDRRRGLTVERSVFVLNTSVNLRDLGLACIHCVTVDTPRRQLIIAGSDIDTYAPTVKVMNSDGKIIDSMAIVPFADCNVEHVAIFNGRVSAIVKRGPDRALFYRTSGESRFAIVEDRTRLEVIKLDRAGHVIGVMNDQYCLVDPATGKTELILRRKPAEYLAGIAYVQHNPHLVIQRDDGLQWRLVPYNLAD